MGPSGRRQLVGEAGKGKFNWHFGISCKPWISGIPHVRILSRIIFSENGFTALDDVRYMHRLRRSVPKGWRNERWRDLLLAFLFWLSKGERQVFLETGSFSGIKLEVPPIRMVCPVSIQQKYPEASEEIDIESDDPVFSVGFDEYDEEEEKVETEPPFEAGERTS